MSWDGQERRGDRLWLDWSLEKRSYALIIGVFAVVAFTLVFALVAVQDRNEQTVEAARRQAQANKSILERIERLEEANREDVLEHRCNSSYAFETLFRRHGLSYTPPRAHPEICPTPSPAPLPPEVESPAPAPTVTRTIIRDRVVTRTSPVPVPCKGKGCK